MKTANIVFQKNLTSLHDSKDDICCILHLKQQKQKEHYYGDVLQN